jgi:hypothetical protein
MNAKETLVFRHGSYDSRGMVIYGVVWEMCTFVLSIYILLASHPIRTYLLL